MGQATATQVIDKLKRAAERAFAGADVQLRRYRPGPRIGGRIVWSGFVGMEQMDRQRTLRRTIDAALAPDEQRRLSMVLTLTPEETAAMVA